MEVFQVAGIMGQLNDGLAHLCEGEELEIRLEVVVQLHAEELGDCVERNVVVRGKLNGCRLAERVLQHLCNGEVAHARNVTALALSEPWVREDLLDGGAVLRNGLQERADKRPALE